MDKIIINKIVVFFRNLLNYLFRSGNGAIVESLIEQGVNVNIKNENSSTPLHLAAIYGLYTNLKLNQFQCSNEINERFN